MNKWEKRQEKWRQHAISKKIIIQSIIFLLVWFATHPWISSKCEEIIQTIEEDTNAIKEEILQQYPEYTVKPTQEVTSDCVVDYLCRQGGMTVVRKNKETLIKVKAYYYKGGNGYELVDVVSNKTILSIGEIMIVIVPYSGSLCILASVLFRTLIAIMFVFTEARIHFPRKRNGRNT